MRIFDTHAHIDAYEFPGEYQDVCRRALDAGVNFVNIGTNKQTSAEALRIAQEFDGVYAAVGLHPNLSIAGYAKNGAALHAESEFDYEIYKQLASNAKVVAIGECGLDYYRKENLDMLEIKNLQSAALVAQINLANELDKALVIHCRASKNSVDAYEDLVAILDQHKPCRFVVHGFTGTLAFARKFVERGGSIAINGIATFDKTGVLKEVIQNLPLEYLVLETDAPYLAPVPLRGKKNEPQHIVHTARFVASEKGLELAAVAEITTANAKRLFSIDAI